MTLKLISPLAALISSIFPLVSSEVYERVLSAMIVKDEQLHSNLTAAFTLCSAVRRLTQVAISSENCGNRVNFLFLLF